MIKMLLKKCVSVIAKNHFLNKAMKIFGSHDLIFNLGSNPVQPGQRKVLFVYVTAGFNQNEYLGLHTNIRESQIWVNLLIKMGFCVDVINCNSNRDFSFLKDQNYQYVIGLGKQFETLSPLFPSASKIILLSEAPPEYSLEREKQINILFEAQYPSKNKLRRTGMFLWREMIEKARVGILLGNLNQVKNYKINGYGLQIHSLYPTGHFSTTFDVNNMQIDRTKILWFGSMGAVHKGLHIAIEAVSHLKDVELWVYGVDSNELKIFGPLPSFVKYGGRVRVGTPEFDQVMYNFTWMIFPSCSESSSTSVITCMNHGIIPIVSKSTFVDTFGYGEVIDSLDSIQYTQAMEQQLKLDQAQLMECRRSLSEKARQEYSLESFERNLTGILEVL